MKSITDSVVTKQYGYGKHFIDVPVDAYSFGKSIIYNQCEKEYIGTVNVLFNKGRYFEATVPQSIIQEVHELVYLPISYDTMICGSWKKLEDFVIALNCLGYYANITIDWI